MNPNNLSPSRHGNVFNRDLQAAARKHLLGKQFRDISDPTTFCQKLRVLAHPLPGKKNRSHVQSDPGELDLLILYHMPRQECMIHAERMGHLKKREKNTRGQIANSSKDVKPRSKPLWNRNLTSLEDNESWANRAGLEHSKLSLSLRDPPRTLDIERSDLAAAPDEGNSALLLIQSSEYNPKSGIGHGGNSDFVDLPLGENDSTVRLPYPSPPVRDISSPSTPAPTGTRKSSPGSPIPHRLVARPKDSLGPSWTAASWKKLAGGLANEGYNSCYLNSLIQVLRQNDGFHNLLVELSQLTSAQKYISPRNNRYNGGLGRSCIRDKTEDRIFEFLYTAILDLWGAETEPLGDEDAEERLPVDTEVGRQNQRSQPLHLVNLLEAVSNRFECGLQHDIAEASTYLVEVLQKIAARRSGASDFPKKLTDRYLTIREQRTVVCPVCSTHETPTERTLTLLSVSPHMNSHDPFNRNTSHDNKDPSISGVEYRRDGIDQSKAEQPRKRNDDQKCDIGQGLPQNKKEDSLQAVPTNCQRTGQQSLSSHPAIPSSTPTFSQSLPPLPSAPSSPTRSVDPDRSLSQLRETLTPQWSLSQAITRYCDQELQWCSTCKVQNRARVQHRFITLPPMLMIHLNRRGDFGQPKDTTKVTINDMLFFRSFTVEGGYQGMEPDYVLTSIVIHSGEDGIGHYYAYVRRDLDLDEVIVNDKGENNIAHRSYRWVCYNDAIVTPTTDDEIQQVINGGGCDGVQSNLATPVFFIYKLQGY